MKSYQTTANKQGGWWFTVVDVQGEIVRNHPCCVPFVYQQIHVLLNGEYWSWSPAQQDPSAESSFCIQPLCSEPPASPWVWGPPRLYKNILEAALSVWSHAWFPPASNSTGGLQSPPLDPVPHSWGLPLFAWPVLDSLCAVPGPAPSCWSVHIVTCNRTHLFPSEPLASGTSWSPSQGRIEPSRDIYTLTCLVWTQMHHSNGSRGSCQWPIGCLLREKAPLPRSWTEQANQAVTFIFKKAGEIFDLARRK